MPHFVSLLFLLFYFAAPALVSFHYFGGDNFKTLAQELGQVEFSYFGEKV